ncbi:hypothetical protein MVEN_02144400 [Mycena venus]|uniref:Uncharacterized protein n=1 Tax=Mycena venus TaxID=2733690 RepID=A0A8H6XAJ0_9AGAR|nr:hypothetical protein MVEN_02144400 [Mycena venus]
MSSEPTIHDKDGSISSRMFVGSHSFTVAGGTFSNVTNNYTNAPAVPSGNPPRTSHVSVEYCIDKWRQDVAKYMSVRHPNIIQICGAASSGNIYATLFHDELIPFKEFLDLHRHSHFSIVYVYAYSEMEFKETKSYFSSTFQRYLSQTECTFAIRRSTGRFCIDLVPSGTITYWYSEMEELARQPGIQSLAAPIDEDMVVKYVPLGHYHKICYWSLSQVRYFPLDISTPVTVNLNAAFAIPPGAGFENGLVEIALLPDADVRLIPWTIDQGATGVVMENGWTRFNCGDTQDTIIQHKRWYWHSVAWLSQANHFFKHLRITSKFEDYVVMEGIEFSVLISGTTLPPPGGYLFLCPTDSFQVDESTFSWSHDPVYWSLDPTGAERLSEEDASNLGFPFIKRFMAMFGRSWDANVYAGLRKFHRAKGFDPHSLDLALHFGYPIYQLSNEVDAPFGHELYDAEFRTEEDFDPYAAFVPSWMNSVQTLTSGSDDFSPWQPPVDCWSIIPLSWSQDLTTETLSQPTLETKYQLFPGP